MTLGGRGLHTGAAVRMRIEPGSPGGGIVFVREDLPGSPAVRASVEAVVSTDRATTLQSAAVRVQTVEHVLAALAATGRWNARVVLSGPEVPIADGSALPFLMAARAIPPSTPAPIRIARRIEIRVGDALAVAEPADESSVEVETAFPAPVGHGAARWDGTEGAFEAGFASARTFAMQADFDALVSRGLAAGASPDCGVLFGLDGPVVGGPLRFPDEPARHKLLDLVGDLALLGAPVAGRIRLLRGGHGLAIRLLRRIVRDAQGPQAAPH